jgi:hypothetical protein
MVMQAWPQMPGAGGHRYGQHNFRQGAATCTAADRAGGSREEAGRCMAVKTAAAGPGTVEVAGLGIVAEREARTTTATTRESIHATIAGGHGPLEVSKRLSQRGPNYHMHLEQLAAKSVATRAAQQQIFQQFTTPRGPLWRFHLLHPQIVILMFIEIGRAEDFKQSIQIT